MTLDAKSWNDEAIAKVQAMSKQSTSTQASESIYAGMGITIYSAAKALSEKEIWNYSKANPERGFKIVSIVPNFNIGAPLHKKQVEQPGTPVRVMQRQFGGLLEGDMDVMDTIIPARRMRSLSSYRH